MVPNGNGFKRHKTKHDIYTTPTNQDCMELLVHAVSAQNRPHAHQKGNLEDIIIRDILECAKNLHRRPAHSLANTPTILD